MKLSTVNLADIIKNSIYQYSLLIKFDSVRLALGRFDVRPRQTQAVQRGCDSTTFKRSATRECHRSSEII